MEVSEANRPQAFGTENARLKKFLATAELSKTMLMDVVAKKGKVGWTLGSGRPFAVEVQQQPAWRLIAPSPKAIASVPLSSEDALIEVFC